MGSATVRTFIFLRIWRSRQCWRIRFTYRRTYIGIIPTRYRIALRCSVLDIVANTTYDLQVLNRLEGDATVDHVTSSLCNTTIVVDTIQWTDRSIVFIHLRQIAETRITIFALVVRHIIGQRPTISRTYTRCRARLGIAHIDIHIECHPLSRRERSFYQSTKAGLVVLRNDTLRLRPVGRSICLELLGTTIDREVILVVETGFEEIAYVVIGLLAIAEQRAPTTSSLISIETL